MRCPHCKTEFLTLLHTDTCLLCRKPLFTSSPASERVSARMVVIKAREGGGQFRYEPSMNSLCDGIWVDEEEEV